MTTDPTHPADPANRAALVALTYGELLVLLQGDALTPAHLGSMPTRLRLAECAIRLAAAADPAGTLDLLARAELAAWIHDPTLYRRALGDDGPAEVRRLMTAITPAAALYAEVTTPHVTIPTGDPTR